MNGSQAISEDKRTTDRSPETKLNSVQLADYKSIQALFNDGSLTKENSVGLQNNSLWKGRSASRGIILSSNAGLISKEWRPIELTSVCSDLSSLSSSFRGEMKSDPSAGPGKPRCRAEGIGPILAACLAFAVGVTVALVMHIYIGTPQVYGRGVVVTDDGYCTALGLEVLHDQGSSVDAAIVAALCLGIVHPHMSGIGGGGVMLVHDSRKNKSRVVDFRETAPSALQTAMLQQDLELKAGLLVGVPGMLNGLHQAHQLYGRMQWNDVITRAAHVAGEGFNVSYNLAEAVSKLRGQHLPEHFRDVFLPDGQALLPGGLLKQHRLAAVLDRVADQGVAAFYSGKISQEIAAEVRVKGGVLTMEDLANYSSAVRLPLESLYQGYLVLTVPPPHAGAALISALNIIEGFNLTREDLGKSAYHWIAESLKAALAMASGLGDPVFESSVSDLLAKMMSKPHAAALRQTINGSGAVPPKHYSAFYALPSVAEASQVIVMGQDDIIVSVSSSLNRPFGSRILTGSGILLNSQILDFSWPNKTLDTTQFNPRNRFQPGKRPLSFLMPTVVRSSQGQCGTSVALGSSPGDRALSGVTQVLIDVLSFHKNLSDSLSSGRLHPRLQPNTLLVDSEFQEEEAEALRLKGHQVQRVPVLSLVHGAQRTRDAITGATDPRDGDAWAQNTSEP